MFLLHKEKERIRHQKQVKLLNEVMGLIPNYQKRPYTKVKKLRHIVLYNSFLKMIHSELKKNLCIPSNENKNHVNKKSSEPLPESPKKEYYKKEKSKRAHIIFLRAEKSANKQAMRHEKTLLNENHKESDLVREYDYKLPDVLIFDNAISNNPLGIMNPFEIANLNEINYDVPISSVEYEIPSESVFMNNYEQAVNAFKSSTYEDLLSNDKENLCYTQSRNLTRIDNINSIEENFCNVEKSQNVISFDENARVSNNKESYFHSFQQDDSEDYILQDLARPNTSNQNAQFLLNAHKLSNFQNLSDKYDYPCIYAPGNYFHQIPLISSSCIPVNHRPEELPVQNLSSVIRNEYESKSSDDSPKRVKMDLEKLSDSNTSCTSFSDSSISLNTSDSPSCHNSSSASSSIQQTLPHFSTIKHVPNYSNLSALYSDRSYLEDSPVRNDISFRPLYNMPQCCFSGVYPEHIFSAKNPVVFSSESAHSLPGRSTVPFNEESDSLYPSSSESFLLEDISMQPNCELGNSDDFPDSSPEDFKPVFSEEVSIPLIPFLKNC